MGSFFCCESPRRHSNIAISSVIILHHEPKQYSSAPLNLKEPSHCDHSNNSDSSV